MRCGAEIVIGVTTSSPTPDQREQVAAFLAGLLPRLEREPGVAAIYHYSDLETGESSTLVVWRDDASRAAYCEGPSSARRWRPESGSACTGRDARSLSPTRPMRTPDPMAA